jgi:diguanylate cyclase (GGDEF)-like protein
MSNLPSASRPGTAVAAPEKEPVERELSRRLAICELGAVRTSFFGYGLQALLLRDVVAPAVLLVWVGAVLLCELINGYLALRLLRAIDEPARRRRLQLALPYTLSLSGAVWGLVAVLPGIEVSPWLHALILLVLAVVALFGANNLSAQRSCLIGYSAGLALPLLVGSFLRQGELAVELGVAALAMLAMVQAYGELTRRLVLRDVRGRVAMEAMAAELRRSNEELTLAMEQLHRVAACDPLTQCLNRRAFLEKLEFELARRTRYGTNFGVILLDLDRFKAINDRHGHDVGDRVLVAVAECLRSQLRPIDSLARWGGEEFLCLVAHVDERDLIAKAEDLRNMIAQSPMVFTPEEIGVTASLGAAICRPDRSALELIALADRAMYKAKGSGRNQVLLAA